MKRTSKRLLTSILTCVFVLNILFGCTITTHAANNGNTFGGSDFSDDMILVKFKAGASEKDKDKLRKNLEVKQAKKFSLTGCEVLKTKDKDKKQVEKLLKQLQNHPLVEYAEPDYKVYKSALVNDPSFQALWGLQNAGDVDIDAPEAWDITFGSTGLVVGVIDEGIDILHPDLMQNIWVNPGEIEGDGIDNDGNGYIDDLHGWDFFHNDNSVYDAADGDDHGTHVAGTIAACANNGIGVAGVAPKVTLMPLKFLGPNGGYTSDAISALEYAKRMKVRLLNNSWGGLDKSQALQDAISSFDGVFVAAAGNDGVSTDLKPHYPSAYDSANILSVAAINKIGALESFSNYGATTVDVAAPGGSIFSTLPGTGYGYKSGTSMAAPHVTGIAALLLSVNPSLSATQVCSIIKQTAVPMGSLNGKISTGGMVNAYAAVKSVTGNGPHVIATDPLFGASGVEPGKTMTVTFDQAISAGEAFSGIQLREGTRTVGCSIRIEGNSVIAIPEGLENNRSYELYIPAMSVTGTSGEGLKTAYALDFSTPDTIKPVLTAMIPVAGDADVSVDSFIEMTFGERIKQGPEFSGITLNGQPLTDGEFSRSVTNNMLNIKPWTGFAYNTDYVLQVPARAVTDLTGNPLDAPLSLSFHTHADNDPPAATSIQPEPGNQNAPAGIPAMVTFNEPIFEGPNFDKIAISTNAGSLDTWKYISTFTLTIRPNNQNGFEPGTRYMVSIPPGAVQDRAGNQNANEIIMDFTTAVYPYVIEASPADGAVNVSKDAGIIVTFSENIIAGNAYDRIELKDADLNVVPATKSIDGNRLYVKPQLLDYNKCYTLSIIPDSLVNAAGNTLQGYFSTSFTTEVNPDTIPPQIKSMYPVDGASGVQLNQSFNINFFEPVVAGSNYNSITLRDASGNALAINKTLNSNSLEIDPVDLFKYETSYVLTVPAGAVKDAAGNGLASEITVRITTVAAPDLTAPTITGMDPADGASGVVPDKAITVTFSEAVKAGNAFDSILLKAGTVVVPIEKTVSGNSLVIKPTVLLNCNTYYTLAIPSGVVSDLAGNGFAAGKTISFTTQDTNPPIINSTDPTTGSTGVGVNYFSCRMNFNEPILEGSAYGSITLADNSGNIAAITKTISGNTLEIRPVATLNYETTYVVTIPAGGVKDKAGNGTATSIRLSFTTARMPDNTAPTIVSVDPLDGAVGVAADKSITIGFSEEIRSGYAYSSITLADSNGNAVAFSKTLSGSNLVIKPTTVLGYQTKYILTLPSAAVNDAAGNALGTGKTVSFTTMSKPDTIAPAVTGSNPSQSATGVTLGSTISIVFSENISLKNSALITVKAGTRTMTFTPIVSGNKLTLQTNGLLARTTYTVTVLAGAVQDQAGNLSSTSYTLKFTTGRK